MPDPRPGVGRTRDGLAFAALHAKAEQPAEILWRAAVQPVAVFGRVDHPDPARSAELAQVEADEGASGIVLVLAGSNAAHAFGLRCDAKDDLPTVLEGVDPGRSLLRFELPDADRRMFDLLLDGLQAAGIDPDHPGLDLAADPLTAAIAGGRDPRAAARSAEHWTAGLAERGVATGLLRVDGRPHHEAGATDAQELAAVLSAGVLYLRALEAAGLPPTGAALRFTLAADADQNLTVAKFRALRRLWARIEAACGATPEPIRLHGETSWRMLARQDPWTNLVRNAIACAGAIVGGADSVTVLPFTGALGLPDRFARRLARNTPLVLMEEAHLARVADASAGSGAFEALTDALCAEAWRHFQQLEAEGGVVEALGSGAWRREIETARIARAERLAAGEAKLVGVTAFAPPLDAAVPPVLMPLAALPSEATRLLPSVRDAEAFEGGPGGRSPASEARS